MLGPALAQGPHGAVAAATGAAAAATAAAPAPKKTAASAAMDMGNSAAVQAKPNAAAISAPGEEEATNGTAPAGGTASPAVTAPGPPLKGVAAQCANLLKMATDLKSEMDKTTKDVLSVAVIRDAGQIEATAKKMREQQH